MSRVIKRPVAARVTYICQLCGKHIERLASDKPAKYCSHSCRSRGCNAKRLVGKASAEGSGDSPDPSGGSQA